MQTSTIFVIAFDGTFNFLVCVQTCARLNRLSCPEADPATPFSYEPCNAVTPSYRARYRKFRSRPLFMPYEASLVPLLTDMFWSALASEVLGRGPGHVKQLDCLISHLCHEHFSRSQQLLVFQLQGIGLFVPASSSLPPQGTTTERCAGRYLRRCSGLAQKVLWNKTIISTSYLP